MPPAAVSAEPSWGRVLATTVSLWVSRRLPRARFTPARFTPGRPDARKPAAALLAAAAVVLAALQFAGVFSPAASRTARQASASTAGSRAAAAEPAEQSAAATRAAAGAWIVGQVSNGAIIGCYPAMCTVLQADGISASRLMPLGPGLAGALSADVIVISPSAGQQLTDELAAGYAPALIASFGSGGSRIEVRAVARGGAAAYQAAMRSDLTARTSAGAQLLRNPNLTFTRSDTAQLLAGEVDSRLLATLAMLSSQYTLLVQDFGDASPGTQLLFRDVTVTSDGKGNSTAALAGALALVNAQFRPYLPARSWLVRLGGGQTALRIEFAEPSPLGLLTLARTELITLTDLNKG